MTAPKNRLRGRPRGRVKPPTEIVGVRLTREQADGIAAAASAAGIPLSTYLREAALEKAGLAALGIRGAAARLDAAGN